MTNRARTNLPSNSVPNAHRGKAAAPGKHGAKRPDCVVPTKIVQCAYFAARTWIHFAGQLILLEIAVIAGELNTPW